MDTYAIRNFAETCSNGKDFLKNVTKNVQEKKAVLSSLITSEYHSENYSFCENRFKHAVRLLVYPTYYNRFIQNMCSDYIQKNKELLLSWHTTKQIEYINSLNKVYITDEMKQSLITEIEKREMATIKKHCHKELVSYFKCRTDEIIEKEIGG